MSRRTAASLTLAALAMGSAGLALGPVAQAGAAQTLSITTTSLPTATQGAPYEVQLEATGATHAVTWSISTTGELPRGLVLNHLSGVITGVPRTVVDETFTVVAHAAGTNVVATQTLTLDVDAAPSPTSTSTVLPNGALGQPYATTIGVMGGTAPYVFVITQGQLPKGLVLNHQTGQISGTPKADGTQQLTVAVMDHWKAITKVSLSLTITGPTVEAITTTTLNNGTEGATYLDELTATGGTAPYRWSIVAGELPRGLHLDSAGIISGIPTANGTQQVTLKVTDAKGDVTTEAASITIAPASAPVIDTTSLPTATAGSPYVSQLQASGGTGPYTWHLVSGQLPDGLHLDPASGQITGEANRTVSETFTVAVLDHLRATATATLTISVVAAAPAS